MEQDTTDRQDDHHATPETHANRHGTPRMR